MAALFCTVFLFFESTGVMVWCFHYLTTTHHHYHTQDTMSCHYLTRLTRDPTTTHQRQATAENHM